ncbi:MULTISPECIES: ribosomal protection-like ABC-F family protein [unclassified Planococcus (in: firmicutes)]|uniref:ribosomal protection-like ABC-F family protein n=1 Tax=unclassified Planococcus (in: firmicutes) TaxID=2662419 RepID=UPI000C335679|nr:MULTISPECIES: ABC-F type ribosomal protection protein [unclassified Planococcus (in: firmicutes)]AUD12674.1 elongation factor 3 [Planococcus sp. MB-3u-03]PKG46798.1 elongation factor 3 [Planococcus sp. Urea-trap-24]PKG89643.1 elongation factor 3 [Planococcus sp. Urea-3u-39]PKH36048.1 elongation factor 3 [Planococcus sp. MB-3u-09]
MTELMKLLNVSVEIEQQPLFENVTANIMSGDRIGIIGKNGAGKTTLLRLIAGEIEPPSGQLIQGAPGMSVQAVEQELPEYAFEDVTAAEQTLLNRWKVPLRDFAQLSGGEKLKARLAKGLAQTADLLLLDEPTNHLDAQGTAHLLRELNAYPGAITIVSHDRYFLDQIATKIWSIENGKIHSHNGNYSDYMEFRERKRISQQHAYDIQQKRIDRIETQMKQLSSWSESAHANSTKQEGYKEYYRVKAKSMDAQVKSKQKRLEKELAKAAVDAVEPAYEVDFAFRANPKAGKRFLEVKKLGKSFGDMPLFKNASFTVQHGEKIAVVGANGSGKTTFLKMLAGEEPVSDGELWLSPSASIGYLTQDVFDLPLDRTPAELFEQFTFKERGRVQNLLKHLGFRKEQWLEPIREMSMGERVKCKLMKFILEDKDALLLDEPTNHLDLPSREQLESTLADYRGTLLVVSHDRYLLDKATSCKLVFEDGTIRKQLGEAPQKEALGSTGELRLKLETERQAVLGKLSFMQPKDKDYAELDRRFMELTKQLKELE